MFFFLSCVHRLERKQSTSVPWVGSLGRISLGSAAVIACETSHGEMFPAGRAGNCAGAVRARWSAGSCDMGSVVFAGMFSSGREGSRLAGWARLWSTVPASRDGWPWKEMVEWLTLPIKDHAPKPFCRPIRHRDQNIKYLAYHFVAKKHHSKQTSRKKLLSSPCPKVCSLPSPCFLHCSPGWSLLLVNNSCRYWPWHHLLMRGCMAKWPGWNHFQWSRKPHHSLIRGF